uniref:Uncharacterized protein n=1 Tax=Oryza barthii TaxID=65489 RepID=A0A0D3HWW1_9ORYZ
MSAQIAPAEQVCYVHCNFCNTILAFSIDTVSVPGNSMLNIVTVRCGHCTNLLSVNLRGLMHSAPALQDHHHHHLQESGLSGCFRDQSSYPEFGFSAASSSSKLRLPPAAAAMVSYSQQNQQLEQALHARQIRRIKANNPDISHREAFSTAAKNWAHYPNIHFGLSPGHEGGKKLVDVDPIPTAPSSKKIQGFYS